MLSVIMLNIECIKGLSEYNHVPRILEQTAKASEEGRGSFLGPGQALCYALGTEQ